VLDAPSGGVAGTESICLVLIEASKMGQGNEYARCSFACAPGGSMSGRTDSSRSSAGRSFGMPHVTALNRRQAQAGQLERHRVHA